MAAPRLLPLMSPRGALALGTCGFVLEVLLLTPWVDDLAERQRHRALHPARPDLRRRPHHGLGAARPASHDADQRAALSGAPMAIRPPPHPPHHPGLRGHGIPGALRGGHGRSAAGRVLGRADRRVAPRPHRARARSRRVRRTSARLGLLSLPLLLIAVTTGLWLYTIALRDDRPSSLAIWLHVVSSALALAARDLQGGGVGPRPAGTRARSLRAS